MSLIIGSEDLDLYPSVHLCDTLRTSAWRCVHSTVLSTKEQVLSPFKSTARIIENCERTLKYRKLFDEQLVRLHDRGLNFMNSTALDRLRVCTWYLYALHRKCRLAGRFDSYVPRRLLIEIDLKRKRASSRQVALVLRSMKDRAESNDGDGLIEIVPYSDEFRADPVRRFRLQHEPTGKLQYVKVVLQIDVEVEKNDFATPDMRRRRRGSDDSEEDDRFEEDVGEMTELTPEDEIELQEKEEIMRGEGRSIGQWCIKIVKPRSDD